MGLRAMSEYAWAEIQRRLTWGSGEVYRDPDCTFGSAMHKVYSDARVLQDAVKELVARVEDLQADYDSLGEAYAELRRSVADE